MIIGYAQITSPADEADLDSQEKSLLEVGCTKVFKDIIGHPASARMVFRDLKKFLRDGEDVVVFTSLRHLGGTPSQGLTLVKELVERGIGLQVLDVGLDSTTDEGQRMLELMAALAEWEHDRRRERSREAAARARAQGRVPGRRPKLDDQQRAAVRKAVGDGEPIAAVARAFQVSRQTVYNVLDEGESSEEL